MIDIRNLPHDFSLVSSLRGASIIPLISIVNHSRFLRLTPTIYEITEACEHSFELSKQIIYCPDPCLVLPYFVDPTVLIISQVPKIKLNDFRVYIKSLIGHSYFEVHPYSSGSFKTRFSDMQTAMSVWRALKYVPLNGVIVKCRPPSSISPFPEIGKLVPKPQRKTKTGRAEKKRRKKKQMAAAKRLEEELPAALPMAAQLSGKCRLPQAVLIEIQKNSKSP